MVWFGGYVLGSFRRNQGLGESWRGINGLVVMFWNHSESF